jgi:hypothetical protein
VEDEAEEAGGGAGVRLEPLLDDAEDDLLGIRARRLVEICRELRGRRGADAAAARRRRKTRRRRASIMQ